MTTARLKIYLIYIVPLLLALAWVKGDMARLEAEPAKGKPPFIIDYQGHLHKKFKKIPRHSTRYIIIHTSEAGLESTLHTLSRGKSVGRYRTIGGHANYTIARDGQVYRILNHPYRADHSGLSMWDGLEDISSHSLGIELVGYHYDTITPQQYQSLTRLLDILQRMYNVPDKNVLTHSQVSYGNPNAWFKRPHRGRKRCALNFEREKAGLEDAWTYDPDVNAGRLAIDRHIHAMFYRKTGKSRKPKDVVASAGTTGVNGTTGTTGTTDITAANKKDTFPGTPPTPAEPGEKIPLDQNLSNIISRTNTAWNIAGEDYDDSTTLYILPGERAVRGDQIVSTVGWDKIPTGTKVLLNQPQDIEKKTGPVFLVNKEYTAWSFAGADYSKPTTFYFLPNGQITRGDQMADWDSLPDNTRMIIGYDGPFTIQNAPGKTPWGIAGRSHNHPETLYFIPGSGITPGDQITDFNDLPRGTQVFLKIIR